MERRTKMSKWLNIQKTILMEVRKYLVKNDILFKIHLNVSGPPKLKEIKIEKHFGNDKLIQLFTRFSGNVSYG